MAVSRRDFFKYGVSGFAIGASTLILRADVGVTESSGSLREYPLIQKERELQKDLPLPQKFSLTEDNIKGPYYRSGAPYRAKITPPLLPGVVLLVRGRVWLHETKKPLAGAVLDIWQADANGRYDFADNDPSKPMKDYHCRARLLTDETGYYEFETVRPGNYESSPGRFRPSHIHYWVRHAEAKELVTQLYFRDDKYNESGDPFIKKSLIMETQKQAVGNASYELGTFDIVLAAKRQARLSKVVFEEDLRRVAK